MSTGVLVWVIITSSFLFPAKAAAEGTSRSKQQKAAMIFLSMKNTSLIKKFPPPLEAGTILIP
jgi:hypothetical protein